MGSREGGWDVGVWWNWGRCEVRTPNPSVPVVLPGSAWWALVSPVAAAPWCES